MEAPGTRKEIIVFTDGAAKGNPGPGGWGVVIVFPNGHVTELGGGAAHTTNNRMELSGAIAALERVAGEVAPVAIYTDSSYVIKGVTQWVWSWQRRGWKTAEGGDVLNRELWGRLSSLVGQGSKSRIAWHWVRGHDGTPGNDRVDRIAVAFSQQQDAVLYDGPLARYGLAVLDLPADTTLPNRAARKPAAQAAKVAAHSYLSVVDGILERHATWAECERRIKGRSGARFKKALSPADEATILKGWNLT